MRLLNLKGLADMHGSAGTGVILFTVILSTSSAAISASPALNIETRYYNIRGVTADALRQQMTSKSTARENDKVFDGYTRWYVHWKFNWKTTGASCKLTTVSTNVDIEYTLPRWLDRDSAPAALKKKWQRYYTALTDHEHGHKEFGVKAAAAIEVALAGMRRDTCAALQSDASTLANTILDTYVAREKQYDVSTRHGMKHGAVFP